jgi:hypothetical protein
MLRPNSTSPGTAPQGSAWPGPPMLRPARATTPTCMPGTVHHATAGDNLPFRLVQTNGKLCITGPLDPMCGARDHTRFTLHRLSFFILDLVGLSLLARQQGPTLPHPVSDAHRSSWSV